MAKNVLVEKFSEPINGVRTVKIDVHAGDVDHRHADDVVAAGGAVEAG